MAEYRIAIFEHDEESREDNADSKAQAEFAAKLASEKPLLIAAEFAGVSARRYVWLVEADEGVEEVIENAPAAKAGLFVRWMPMLLGKGSLSAEN